MSIIEQLRRKRKSLRMTQAELAAAVQISRTQIVNLEKEVSDTTTTRAELLAEALGCEWVLVLKRG